MKRRGRTWRGWGFAGGVALVVAGVVMQLPDAMMLARGDAARSMWSPAMIAAMLLIVAGVVVAGVSLLRATARSARAYASDEIENLTVTRAHVVTLVILVVALVVDTMKPLTLGFVLPGMRQEYGLPTADVAVLPLAGLIGTAIGSVIWGLLADRYGRRAALLSATILFIATAACGAMPAFGWNLVMCFIMGLSAGGMLPLVFTLLAELLPRRHRGWVGVTVGAVGGLGGYLATSTAAHLLEPVYSWRALWLIGLPTGLVLLLLARWIPESPLYLLRTGQSEAAERVLARYGSRVPATPRRPGLVQGAPRPGSGGAWGLLKRFPVITAVLGIVGCVWGLANFGFLVMLPVQLNSAGLSEVSTSGLLTEAALYSVPAVLLVAVLYAVWGGRRSLALLTGATALGLGGIAMWSLRVIGEGPLIVSISVLVLGLYAVNAMLLPYATTVYPTELRGTGSGFAAAATKLGGILGPSAMLLAFRFGFGLIVPAVILLVLSLITAGLLVRYGLESGVRRAALRPVSVR